MKNKLFASLTLAWLSTLNPEFSTFAQGTAFTYQGRLNDGANPANGTYNLRFALFDALTVGNQVGPPLTNSPVNVSNGLFTVVLDFGANFPGADRWLEIGVRTNGGSAFATLSPRQKLTPTPYAIFAGTVGTNGLAAGTYANAVTLNNPANIFSGSGTGLSNVNAISLGGFGAASFWNLGGNAGTTPGAQFLGTTDNLPMEFKVNGARALRLEPNPNAPNVIGGSAANVVTNGNYGAVIAGGGSAAYPNRVGAIYGTVVGGSGNTASGNSATAMGQFNTASGYAGTAMGYSTVAGGFGSQAGGTTAKANHDGTFVWADNTFLDFASTAVNQFLIRAAGGVGINTNNPNGAALAVNGNITVNNTIGTPGNQPLELKVNNQRGLRLEPTASTDTVNVIGGSSRNFVGAGTVGATIGGGGSGVDFGAGAHTNVVQADFGTISGGLANTIETNAGAATISGGDRHTIQAGAEFATIGGGDENTIQTSALWATISGGILNTIQPYANQASIGGGFANTVQSSANNSTIGGGYQNTIQTYADSATIGGGYQNTIQLHAYSTTIGGGEQNTIPINAFFATIPGGRLNSATNYAFAAGNRAKANHTGAFVWADSTDADFASTANNQFLIRATGGMGLGTPNPQGSLHVYSDNNPTVVRVQSTGTPGFGRVEFVSNPQGDANEWRPGYIQSTDNGGFTGGLAFFVNGTGGGSKFGNNEVMRLVNGNVGIGTNAPQQKLHVIGNILASGTVNGGSDRNVKEHFSSVNPRDVLDKVSTLPITQWNYIADGETLRHIGPMAQDFYSVFNVGMDDKHISMVDADGVALAAIQGLNQKVEQDTVALRSELNRKDAEIQQLKQRLDALENILVKQK